MKKLQEIFIPRLATIIPKEHFNQVLNRFNAPRPFCLRINALKAQKLEVLKRLESDGIKYREVDWVSNALVLLDFTKEDLHCSLGNSIKEMLEEGAVYQQSLSSMLVSVILDPQKGENVLDMCAAPGSKTTQISSMMMNTGQITCIDNVKNRYYKLKHVATLMGSKNCNFVFMDARRFKPVDGELFDRILLDAPCSSEGRFNFKDKKTYAYWSLRKIKEMQKKQKGLLLSAGRLLRPGGVLVYSTCTFAPEENEAVIDWFLKKSEDNIEICDSEMDKVKTYEAVLRWKDKDFDERVKKCLRILPEGETDGFFIAKLRKKKES